MSTDYVSSRNGIASGLDITPKLNNYQNSVSSLNTRAYSSASFSSSSNSSSNSSNNSGISPSATLTDLADFNGTTGSNPEAPLVALSNGLFYGTTYNGGANGDGTVYEFNANTNTITKLADFNGTNGSNPVASLVALSNGVFYGTTYYGGANNKGTVYEFNANTNTITDIADFNGRNGSNPYASLVAAGNGVFYGTTDIGGVNNNGTVYEFNANTNTVTKLADFNGTNGTNPDASLIAFSNGVFYGTAFGGGANGDGTVYEFNANINTITKLADFDGTNGTAPYASLVAGGNGVFYGTTFYGGATNDGTVYEFKANTNTINKLADFNGTNGTNPGASMVALSNGFFYGTTYNGGANGDGTIYEFNANTNSITKIADFNGTNGTNPVASLVAGSNGFFYGTTAYGGANNDGDIYNIQLSVTPTPNDLNGDGKSDLLWRNSATGENVVWFMNGSTLSSYQDIFPVYDKNWFEVGTGDFNGDGKTDILWRNLATGEDVVWIMNGSTLLTSQDILAVPDRNWNIVGTGDVNNDGKTDILWRNSATGENVVWFMNGTTLSSTQDILPVYDTNWQIVGTGDFNKDGNIDIVWRNKATGEDEVWFMNGTTISSTSDLQAPAISDTNWHIMGTGDFNGDGNTDLVWRNSKTGENVIWFMNGIAMSSYQDTLAVPDQNWQIVGL